MAQLRHKLEPDPGRPRWLITEPGMGYRYQPPDDQLLGRYILALYISSASSHF
jgi:two-component system KDP operon response regulator KdpE